MSLRRLIKNTSYLIISEQVARIANLVQLVLLVRYLGMSDYGIWSLVQSMPGMFMVLTDMGINSVMLRKISTSRDKRSEYLSQVVLLKIALSVLFVTAVWTFSSIARYDPEVKKLIFCSAIAYSLFCLSDVLVAVYRAMEKFIFETVISIARSALFLCSVCVVIQLDLRLDGIVYSLMIVNASLCMVALLWYVKEFALEFRIYPFHCYIALLKESLPFAVLALVNPIFFQIDVIMLSQLSTFASTGIYNAAYRIVLFIYVIPMMMRKTLFPRFSVLSATAPEEFRESFSEVFRLTALLALPASVGLFLLSNKIVFLLFSADNAASIIPLKVLSLTIVFHCLRSIHQVALYSSNLERPAVTLFSIGTLANIVLDLILIKQFDFVGAALAALISEIIIFLCYSWYVRKRLFKHSFVSAGLKIALCTIVMALVVRACDPFPLIVQSLVGFGSYTLSLAAFGVLNEKERCALQPIVGALKRALQRTYP